MRLRLERGSKVAAGPDSSEEGLPEVVEVLVGRGDDDLAALDAAKAGSFPELYDLLQLAKAHSRALVASRSSTAPAASQNSLSMVISPR